MRSVGILPNTTLEAEPSIRTRIGAHIRVLRKRSRLTQTGVGEAIGVSYQQVQKYESGTDSVTSERLFRLAELFDVPVSFLLGVVPRERRAIAALEGASREAAVERTLCDPAGLSDELIRETKDLIEVFTNCKEFDRVLLLALAKRMHGE